MAPFESLLDRVEVKRKDIRKYKRNFQQQNFNPDAQTRATLDRAAKTAYKMSRAVGFEETFNGNSLRMYADRHWINPLDNMTPPTPFTTMDLSWMNVAEGYLDLDARMMK